MPHRFALQMVRGIPALAIVLAGCAGDPQSSGRAILDGLQRDGIPLPPPGDAPPAATAAALPDADITLADLLDAAERAHPELGAARSRVGAAAGRAWQASLYPNPSVDVEVEDIGFREGLDTAETTVGFRQPLILGGRRQAATAAAGAERAARLAEVESVRREVLGAVAEVHTRVLALREESRVLAELLEITGRTLATAEARFEAGAAAEPEVIRPRVEVFALRGALGRAGRAQAAAEARLGLLVGADRVPAGRLAGAVDPHPTALDLDRLSRAVRAHPDLLAADREIDAAAARLERVRAERVPDLDVRVGAGYAGERGQGIVELGAGMEVPLWDRRQGEELAARFELMQMRQRRAAREAFLLGELAGAHGEYEAAREQLAIMRDSILPGAQRAFDQIGEAYRAGRAPFLELLDAQRALLEARRTEAQLAGEAGTHRARIARLAGIEFLTGSDISPTHAAPRGAEVLP